MKKALFDRAGVGYPVGVRQYEELPVMPVLAKYASRIGVVNAPLYNYYQRFDGSSASNAGADATESFSLAYKKMVALLGSDYQEEARYHAIYALLYGRVLGLCKQKASSGQIRQAITEFEEKYPHYRANPYLPHMGWAKRLFLHCADKKWVCGLRLLSWVHGKLTG